MSDEHKNDETPPAAAKTEPPPAPATNGAASDAQPQLTASDEETIRPAPEVVPYLYYVERLVAVQLKNPYAVIDHKGPVKMVANDGKERIEGMPCVVTDEHGNLTTPPQSVVVGALTVGPCGTALGLLINSPDTGAVLRLILLPKDIAYITVVARLPPQQPEPSRIVIPGAN